MRAVLLLAFHNPKGREMVSSERHLFFPRPDSAPPDPGIAFPIPLPMRLFCLLLLPLYRGAQQRTTLVGRLEYPDVRLNDVWGYAAPDGTEYALVGTRGGTSIVSLADPAQPEELFYIEGQNSTWRDLKTWNQTAYVTTDGNVTEGVLVVDLSQLPDAAPHFRWTPEVTTPDGTTDTLFSFHNLYIDELGRMYLSGGNVLDGGVVVADVTGSGPPVVVGFGPPVYGHDVYARDGLLYVSEIIEGHFSIYDVSDPANFELLGSRRTPFEFTHNAWLSDDGRTLFTTDERPDAPVASYDVSDPQDIRYLDEIRADTFYGRVLIPHNVHILNDYVVTSNYLAGLTVFDGAEPDNLVQTAQYLTPAPDNELNGGFHGAWGAYPFLPSGLVLVSDIERGLFVVAVDYRRAARFRGTVVSAATGAPVVDATLTYPRETLRSDLSGAFAGGLADAQTIELRVAKPGFEPRTVSVDLTAGETESLTIELTPLPKISIGGRVTERRTGVPLADTRLRLVAPGLNYQTTTDADGQYAFEEVFINEYTVAVGRWGHLPVTDTIFADAGERFDFTLRAGFADDFNQDLGFTVESMLGAQGTWERGTPATTTLFGNPANPFGDTDNDGIVSAYVTGLAGGSPTDNDLDLGETTLLSPMMDLSNTARAELRYSYWWLNDNPRDGADSLQIFLENGTQTLLLNSVSRTTARTWRDTVHVIDESAFEFNATVRLRVVATDTNVPNTIEAGFDRFRLTPLLRRGAVQLEAPDLLATVFPNPFASRATVRYRIDRPGTYRYSIVDALGRERARGALDPRGSTFDLPDLGSSGTFYLLFFRDDERIGTISLVATGRR